jgi:hypothetical protein
VLPPDMSVLQQTVTSLTWRVCKSFCCSCMDMSGLQLPVLYICSQQYVLPLEVSGLQQSVLPLDVSILVKEVLKISGRALPIAACASFRISHVSLCRLQVPLCVSQVGLSGRHMLLRGHLGPC